MPNKVFVHIGIVIHLVLCYLLGHGSVLLVRQPVLPLALLDAEVADLVVHGVTHLKIL